MSDKPRSIIDPASELVKPDRLILSPEEAVRRTKGIPAGGKDGYKPASKAEAISIACQIGQQVYDQLRSEHAATMGNLQVDLANHLREIKEVVAMNIHDLQSRSFSYRVRRDFVYDVQCFGRWLVTRRELALAWLELHGLREAPPAKEPEAKVDSTSAIAAAIAAENSEPITKAFETEVDDSFDAPDIAGSIELHVGAPTEPPTG